MSRVLRTEVAHKDYREIWYYIALDNEAAANRLVQAFDNALKLLATYPRAGRPRPRLIPSLRSFPVGQYLLFYRPIDDGIELLRVIHGKRKFTKKLFEEQ